MLTPMSRLRFAAVCLLIATPAMAGILPLMGMGKPAAGGGGGCAEATAFLVRAGSLSGNYTSAYTTMICGLVTDGVWAKMDALYILKAPNSTVAGLNLLSTSFTLSVGGGSPTFTPDTGYSAGASGDYLETGFNSTTASSPQYTQNSAHYSIWKTTNVQDGGALMGVASGTQALFVPFNGDGKFYGRINDTGLSFAASGNTGLFHGNRSGANNSELYQNGTSLATTGALGSSAPTNSTVEILRSTGSASVTGVNVAAASIGSSLNSTEAGNLFSRLNTYMGSVP